MGPTPLRETVLCVDLDRLAENVRSIRQFIGPEPRFVAVVKGDGYGHGAIAIAPVLLENGADILGVATVSEGIELRNSGITCPIFLLGYTSGALLRLAVDFGLTPAAVSLAQAEEIDALGAALGKKLPVNVVLDSGMHRLGLPCTTQGQAELLAVLRMPFLQAVGIFSHFAQTSQETDRRQYAAFSSMLEAVSAAGLPVPPRHICESVATVEFPQYHHEMVRVGTLLYGTRTYPTLSLQPVASLRSIVSAIRTIKTGEGVGYGFTWTANRPTVLGTMPFGFADGFSAQLAGIASVLIHGKQVPLVGKICMDQCMVDLTDLDTVSVGDEVIIFGDGSRGENTVAGLCDMMHVTRGEVLCRISRRVPRLYFKNGEPVSCADLTAV